MRRIISLVFIFLLIILDIYLGKGSLDAQGSLKQLNSNNIKLSDLQKENQNLKNSLQKTDSPFFLEKEARNKLGLEKPGETTIVIPDQQIEEANVKQEKVKTTAEKWFGLITNSN